MPEVALQPAAGADTAVAVARALLEASCVAVRPTDPVTFTSGLRSPVYVDNRRLISQPGAWRVVVEAIVSAIGRQEPEVEVVAGVESSGIPHSSAVAYAAGLPTVFVRKASREHGMGQRIEGGEVAGRHVVLVEDMVTTGGSSLSAIAALRDAGASVQTCLAIVSYGFAEAIAAFADVQVGLGVLTTIGVVLDEGVASGRMTAEDARVVHRWLADPHGWLP